MTSEESTGDMTPSANLTYRATAGEALPPDTPLASHDDIVAGIKAVQDPELLLNVYELGLIYDIKQSENGDVFVLMTLTSPMCPMAGEMPGMVANAAASVPGTGVVTVELTFEPPWTVERLSEDLRLMMGF